MRVLVLGGTSFIGRTAVELLHDRGAQVSLFTRGRTGPGLFPDLDHRRGDRAAGDYASLLDGPGWDAVLDVSGYVPRHVAQAEEVLRGRVGRYLFVSTVSVYDHRTGPARDVDETAPRLAPVRDTEDHTSLAYGGLKVACEDDVAALWGERSTVVRPGIVAGPHDPTDRFTWWVRRASLGGRVAVPGRLDQPVQVVDVADLAHLLVTLLQDDRPGTFDATGPADATTLAGLLAACATAAGTTVEPVGVPVQEGFPLVLHEEGLDPLFSHPARAARAVGLTATPLQETARRTLAWDRERGLPALRVGPDPADRDAEAALLSGT